ncbi:MAG TPA: tRNA pseudouridine(55) synthase TruB [Bryobacteraceae bacterium]|nr:tRNA pseudouridine(55) synthase TruB [Bryobacteraceae bacterium]
MNGAVIVNKPSGWTSHDAVNKIRRLAGTRKVGHLGTLDPLATGVLPLVLNGATRLAQFYTKSDKVYDGVIRFGYSTDTYDAEGRPTSPETEPAITLEQLEPLLAAARGTFCQTPPPVSAKKINGTPAYKLARKNKPVELAPVEVTVYSLEVISLEGVDLRVVVHCSAGTYLRAIAHDLGQAVGCGAFLKSLHRTRSGDFPIGQAHTLEELAELSEAGEFEKAIIPAAQLLPEFPCEVLDQVTTGFVRQGRDFRVSPFRVRPGSTYVKALAPDGELLAIGEARLPNLYHPILVL